MANHDSRKRAAGREPVGKRALSLLMALVMSLSLVQISAFAASDENAVALQKQQQIMQEGATKYYDAAGAEIKNCTDANENWVVKLTRKLVATGTENLFNVEMEVTTRDNSVVVESPAAATLVIDISGSMDFCADCGAKKGDGGRYHHKNGCQYKNKTTKTRLDAAKEAAVSFLENFRKNANGTVSGASRYVSIVTFSTLANSRQIKNTFWVDVTNKVQLEAAKTVVNGLSAKGGTNTEAGLQIGRAHV